MKIKLTSLFLSLLHMNFCYLMPIRGENNAERGDGLVGHDVLEFGR
jgi:hypothetical protein